jgi:hypothetical protein
LSAIAVLPLNSIERTNIIIRRRGRVDGRCPVSVPVSHLAGIIGEALHRVGDQRSIMIDPCPQSVVSRARLEQRSAAAQYECRSTHEQRGTIDPDLTSASRYP